MKNLYQILGLEPSATFEEIKKAFKKHAKHYHPDLHNGDKFFEEKFIEVKEAYEVLGNEKKRAEYDSYYFQAFQNATNDNNSEDQSDNNYDESESSDSELEDEIERALDWAWKKHENGDLYGAIEELENAEAKFPDIGHLNFVKGQAYQNYQVYIPALREYKIAVKKGCFEAKDSIIEIEKLQRETLEEVKPYLNQYPIYFTFAGVILFLFIPDFATGLMVGEVVNLVGAIVIIRRGISKVQLSVINSFIYNWEYNSSVMIGIFGAMLVLPLVAFSYFSP